MAKRLRISSPMVAEKIWWRCEKGHEWKALAYSRAGLQKTRCPVCVGKVNPALQQRYRTILTEHFCNPDVTSSKDEHLIEYKNGESKHPA